MARPTVGAVTEHKGRDGRTYRSLRFTAYGKRRRVPLGAVSATDAESALRHVIADVERGTWQPDTIEAPAEPERPARGDGRNGAHRPRARAARMDHRERESFSAGVRPDPEEADMSPTVTSTFPKLRGGFPPFSARAEAGTRRGVVGWPRRGSAAEAGRMRRLAGWQ